MRKASAQAPGAQECPHRVNPAKSAGTRIGRVRRVTGFERTLKGCKAALKLLRREAPTGAQIGIVMEATGTFAEEVGFWLLKRDPTLDIAIVNPMQTSAFIKSLGLRTKTDDLDARALALCVCSMLLSLRRN